MLRYELKLFTLSQLWLIFGLKYSKSRLGEGDTYMKMNLLVLQELSLKEY